MTISRYSTQDDMSSSCGPTPTMRPSSRTMILSACRIVLTRWATISTVALSVSDLRAARSFASVDASSAEKQSSNR